MNAVQLKLDGILLLRVRFNSVEAVWVGRDWIRDILAFSYQKWYKVTMPDPTLDVTFYKSEAGCEPVRDWLKSLSMLDRKSIGEDIKTIQYGWPLGMPLVRKMGVNLWEVRTHLVNRIARVLFTLDGAVMVLLHGFIKKSDKTPAVDLKTAMNRLK